MGEGHREEERSSRSLIYVRHCQGSTPKYVKAGDNFDEALVAKIRFERRLRAQSVGATIPEDVASPMSHRCDACLDSYVAFLRSTRKRNGRKYVESSILARESDINAFLKFSPCVYVEQITREILLRYKNHLYERGMASDTVLNKLICITSWMRRNQIVSIIGVLKPEDEEWHDDAEEWINCNMAGAHLGPNAPVIVVIEQ